MRLAVAGLVPPAPGAWKLAETRCWSGLAPPSEMPLSARSPKKIAKRIIYYDII